jgi:hypothetical protein
LDYLNGKTLSKKCGPISVLIKEKDQAMVAWNFVMKEVTLSITLQH